MTSNVLQCSLDGVDEASLLVLVRSAVLPGRAPRINHTLGDRGSWPHELPDVIIGRASHAVVR